MWLVKKTMKLLKLEQMYEANETPERNVMQYLLTWNPKLRMDNFWNLYLFKPGKPVLCAHMDTVQTKWEMSKLSSIKIKDWVISWNGIRIWADDKLGVALAMQIYDDLDWQVSLLFTRQEETGTNGSEAFVKSHKTLLEQAPYVLVLDRMGSTNIVWYQKGFCSKEFEVALEKVMKPYWYKGSLGWHSDCAEIKTVVNTVNLSIWYYGHHTDKEKIIISEAEHVKEAIIDVVKTLKGKYPIYKDSTYTPPVLTACSHKQKKTLRSYLNFDITTSTLTVKENIEIMPMSEDSRESIMWLKKWQYTLWETADEDAYYWTSDYTKKDEEEEEEEEGNHSWEIDCFTWLPLL